MQDLTRRRTRQPMRRVISQRHRINMARQHHPRIQPETRTRHHGITEALHLRMLKATQRSLNGVRDRLLMVRRRLNIHQRSRQNNRVRKKI